MLFYYFKKHKTVKKTGTTEGGGLLFLKIKICNNFPQGPPVTAILALQSLLELGVCVSPATMKRRGLQTSSTEPSHIPTGLHRPQGFFWISQFIFPFFCGFLALNCFRRSNFFELFVWWFINPIRSRFSLMCILSLWGFNPFMLASIFEFLVLVRIWFCLHFRLKDVVL